jgi:hypothetical protein
VWGPPVHQIITADALSFVKPDVVNTIAENVAIPDSSVFFLNNNYHIDSNVLVRTCNKHI